VKLIPSKTQFNNWSLPSKIGYIGFVLAIIAIIIAIIFFIVTLIVGATKEGQVKAQKDREAKHEEQQNNFDEVKSLVTDKLDAIRPDVKGHNAQKKHDPTIASNDNNEGEENMAKDGKGLEWLVQLIEKSIAPDAIVEHDVDMPVLNSSRGSTAQCDIVIRSGKEPRQTVTIIEVQDRGSRVKPNDFRGWKQKLEDVGAQRLICVSRQEFPESIKEQASLLGNSIILVTLKEADPESLPLDFINVQYQYRHFQLITLNHVQPSISKSEAISLGVRDALLSRKTVKANDLCWSIDGQHLVSLYVLCRDYYSPPDGLTTGTGKISFDLKEEPSLFCVVNDVFIRAGLDCEFEWTNEIIDKPVSVLTYEQDEFGALAWVAEIIHESPKGRVVFRIPLVKSGDKYILRSVYAELPKDTEFLFSVIKK